MRGSSRGREGLSDGGGRGLSEEGEGGVGGVQEGIHLKRRELWGWESDQRRAGKGEVGTIC